MKRFAAITLCLTMAISLLAGCQYGEEPYVPTGDGLNNTVPTQSTAPVPDKVQELSMVYYPEKTLNPYLVADFTNRALFGLMYQGLFSTDMKYQPTPILCSGYTVSKDMKTYEFHLEKATFSDGSAVTAADVVASLLAAKEGPVYKGRFTYVREISANAEGNVVIQLNIPYENLPILLDVPIVKAGQVKEPFPLGSGPYVVKNAQSGTQLVRRQDWWCDAALQVTAPYIPLVKAESPAQIRDAFEFSDVGLVCTDPGSDTYVDYRCDYELWDCENGIFLYLGCNDQSEVFSVPEVRTALTHAINRDVLVETLYRGFAESATLPASPDSPYYDAGLASKYGYDVQKFVNALEKAELKGKEIKLLVNDEDSRRVRTAKAIARMLTECGLTVEVKALGGDSYRNALQRNQYDLHLGQTILSPNMDLSAFFYVQGVLNFGGMSDAGIFAMCQETLANSGHYYTLHQMVMEDGMLCPILFRSYAVYASRGLVSRIAPARDQIFFYTLGKTMESVYIKP